MNKNHLYVVIGVEASATKEEIRIAYKRKAQKMHPDKHNNHPSAERLFKQLQEAYEILMDDGRRAAYDSTGATEKKPDIDDVAMKKLAEIFSQIVEKVVDESTDLIQEMNKAIKRAINQNKDNQKKLVLQQAKLKKMENRVIYSGDNENLFQIVLSDRIDAMRENHDSLEREVLIQDRVLELLAEYTCTTKQPEHREVVWGETFNAGWHGSTS